MSARTDAINRQTGSVEDADLALIGRALGEPSRAAMLSALMTGTAWTVGELASWAKVARSTASEHVTHLATIGLVRVHHQGRHAYVTLADERVADALEGLALLAPPRPTPSSLRGQRYARELAQGRTCYGHLAGRVGVQLTDRLVADSLLTPDFVLTDMGTRWFADRGVSTKAIRGAQLLRPCMDWSERRPHLAGPLITLLTTRALEEGWVQRGSHPRSIRLTTKGAELLLASHPPESK